MNKTQQDLCPGGCGFPRYPGEFGDVYVCPLCGYLSECMEDGWQEPNAEDRAKMMASPAVIDAIMMARAYSEHRIRDRDRLRSELIKWMIEVADATATVDEAADQVATALQDIGFHTHPSTEDQ